MDKQFKQFRITQASNQYTEEIKKVVFSVLLEYGLPPEADKTDADLKDVDSNYNNNSGFFGLVWLDDKIVGTFGLYKLDEERCEIRKMYLLPETRGHGLGKYLMNVIIELAKNKGYKIIELETAGVLKEAIGLYKKFGFKEMKFDHNTPRCDQAFSLELNRLTPNGV